MSYSNTFFHEHSIGKSTWHVEWCTKYRYKLFKSLYHKNICMIALDEAAKRVGVVLLEKEVQPEHIHLVVELPLTIAPIVAIGKIKGLSAKIIFALRPKLRLRYPKGHLWSTGKFATSVGYITLDKAKEYVKNQEAHHAKNTEHRNPRSEAKRRSRAMREPLGRGGGQFFYFRYKEAFSIIILRPDSQTFFYF